MYNVLADFHHASLLQSLILLFEKRLGGSVYRPIGTEWFEKGFWKVYDHPATVQQFLGINAATPDGTAPLNEVLTDNGSSTDGVRTIYKCYDIDSGQTNKAVTFDGFMNTHIDIVIASIPAHIEPFKRLCQLHPNHPKLIFQIGNAWTVEAGLAPNIMASAKINGIPESINFIEYHQEFDLDTFYPQIPLDDNWVDSKYIASFVNVFNGEAHLAHDWQLFQDIEVSMPDWTFKSYGGQCRDGAIGPASALAEEMRTSRFIWHTKAGGDGYGHVIHNAAAVARPLIVKKEYYTGKLGEALMVDGETCIAIDGLNPYEIREKIEFYNEPERYRRMCELTYANFLKKCDFNEEFKQIKFFLEKLV